MYDKEYRRKYYRNHHDEVLEYMQQYAETHKEQLRQYRHEYYLKNKKRFIESQKKRRSDPKIREQRTLYNREWARQARKNNPEKFREIACKHRKECEAIWGSRVQRGSNEWRKAEAFAEKILSYEGFTNIIHLNQYFPFDYLCIRNGEKYAIDVTVTTHKKVNETQKKLIHFFGLHFIVLFIKPKLDMYLMREVMPPFKSIGILNMRWLRQLKPTPKDLLIEPIQIAYGERRNEEGILKMRMCFGKHPQHKYLFLNQQIPQEYLMEEQA